MALGNYHDEGLYGGTDSRYNRPRENKVESKKKTAAVRINVGNIDYGIAAVVSVLVIVGVIMVFSSSYYFASSRFGDAFLFFRKQAMFAVVGFCGMFIMSNIDYHVLRHMVIPLYLFSVVFLVLVLLFGEEYNGAKRWIEIKYIGNFQPSEVAKISLIITLAHLLSKYKNMLKKFSGFMIACAVVGVMVVLIALGNLSTAIITATIGFGIIFIASPYTVRFVMMGIGAVGGLVSYLVFFSSSFRNARIQVWLDPWIDPINKGYQAIQSLYAIGSGGFFGLGLGASRQKMGFLPEPHNDIIFSVICEELGFLGAAVILFFFIILIWRGFTVAMNSIDLFGSLIAAGIVIMFACQVVINVAVATNSMPNTGVPLPFISAGGTSLVIMMGAAGILLNISRYSKIT